MELLHLKRRFMKRTCGAWSTAAPYEAALSSHEAKPFQASCFFALVSMVAGPRWRGAASVSTAARKGEERRAITPKTGTVFRGDQTEKKKTAVNTIYQAVCLFYGVCRRNLNKKMVAGPRIELGTRGFSVPCSTDWANLPLYTSLPWYVYNIYPFFGFVKSFLSFFLNFFAFFQEILPVSAGEGGIFGKNSSIFPRIGQMESFPWQYIIHIMVPSHKETSLWKEKWKRNSARRFRFAWNSQNPGAAAEWVEQHFSRWDRKNSFPLSPPKSGKPCFGKSPVFRHPERSACDSFEDDWGTFRSLS